MNPKDKSPALEPAIIVIFGITGDLSRRKLLPALYHLFKDGLLDENTVILGVTRQKIDVTGLLDKVTLCINEVDGVCDMAAVAKLKSKLKMMQMDITEGAEYDRLLIELNKIEDATGMCMNRLFYLSIPPQVTQSIITLLGEHGLNKSCPHNVASSRLLIEKPFGQDLKSAQELIKAISVQFKEDQIFRIDHYLAKETVQNIIVFRFNNIFEEIWNNQHISHIIITAAETIGIEGRTVFYEQVGALRDFVQNHLFQLLALTTLDLPPRITNESLHAAKLELLNSIKPVPSDKVFELSVRGQYKTYRQEVNNPRSNTETYAALRLEIDNDRWKGVPFLLKTGKMLAKKTSEIRVVFRPQRMASTSNTLVFRLQPAEGIELDLLVKKPGFDEKEEPQVTAMDFSYQGVFDNNGHPDAYERVLVDAVRGDHTLFSTSKEVLRAWEIVEPVIHTWQKSDKGLQLYEPGSDGPAGAAKLISGLNSDNVG